MRWAPRWVVADCGLEVAGTDEDGGRHLPIWNACFWGHAVDLYRHLFDDLGIAADPDLVLAYAPGGFAWSEFDFDVVDQAVAAGAVTVSAFWDWSHQMVPDLAGLMVRCACTAPDLDIEPAPPPVLEPGEVAVDHDAALARIREIRRRRTVGAPSA